jgi:hypothetical protein
MKIDRKGQIGGQPLKLVRDFLRSRRHGYISVENIVHHLQQNWWNEFIEDLFERDVIDRDARNYARKEFDFWSRQKTIYGARVPKMPNFNTKARTLFDHLLAEEYIERVVGTPDDPAPNDGKVRHRTTMKGQALLITTLAPRINRAKAEALLKGVLERVAAINADPELMHWVTEVRVFGSYLTDSDDLGDLDLALSYQRRPTKKDDLKGFTDAIKAFVARHGKQHLSWEDQMFLPERMMKQRIKGRSPYISMHGIDELEQNPGFAGKTVYTFMPPK